MFRKMMEYENAWDEFREWLDYKYGIVYKMFKFSCSGVKHFIVTGTNKIIAHDFILSIMPFFFDKKEIYIHGQKLAITDKKRKWEYRIEYNENGITKYKWSDKFDNREEALKQVCEIGFEIFNKQLEAKE